jgi:hypothetical protein
VKNVGDAATACGRSLRSDAGVGVNRLLPNTSRSTLVVVQATSVSGNLLAAHATLGEGLRQSDDPMPLRTCREVAVSPTCHGSGTPQATRRTIRQGRASHVRGSLLSLRSDLWSDCFFKVGQLVLAAVDRRVAAKPSGADASSERHANPACPRVYFDQLHPNFPQPPNRRAGGCGAEEEVVKVIDP